VIASRDKHMMIKARRGELGWEKNGTELAREKRRMDRPNGKKEGKRKKERTGLGNRC